MLFSVTAEFKSKKRSSQPDGRVYLGGEMQTNGLKLKGGHRQALKARQSVTENQRWDAVVRRDRQADGKFYYSVRTTGVYCRPSCAARLARPENVQFHETCADAEKAGYRPCKRCKPNEAPASEQIARKIAAACRLIETSETAPSLEQLARHAEMS